jgi:hypothetical protein
MDTFHHYPEKYDIQIVFSKGTPVNRVYFDGFRISGIGRDSG